MTYMGKNRLLVSRRIGTGRLLLLTALFLGYVCACEDDPQNESLNEEEISENYIGEKVFEVSLGKHSVFKVIDHGSDAALVLYGHVDDSEVLEPIVESINSSKSYADIFSHVTGKSSVPERVLALDSKFAGSLENSPNLVIPSEELATNGETQKATARQFNGEYENSENLPEIHRSISNPDATWDWVEDCTWFLNLAGNTCDSRWAATSVTWAFSGHLESQQHWAYLMAASHTYGTDISAQQWNGSSWTTLFSAYVNPRYYYSLWYGDSSSSKKWRRFYNTGRGGDYARTHTHIGWNIKVPSGGIGQICFHTYLCTTPWGN